MFPSCIDRDRSPSDSPVRRVESYVNFGHMEARGACSSAVASSGGSPTALARVVSGRPILRRPNLGPSSRSRLIFTCRTCCNPLLNTTRASGSAIGGGRSRRPDGALLAQRSAGSAADAQSWHGILVRTRRCRPSKGYHQRQLLVLDRGMVRRLRTRWNS